MSSVVKKGGPRFAPKVQPRAGRRRLSSVSQKPSAAATKQLKEAAAKVANDEAIIEEEAEVSTPVALPATPQASQAAASQTPASQEPPLKLHPRPRSRHTASERPTTTVLEATQTQEEQSTPLAVPVLATPPASQATQETQVAVEPVVPTPRAPTIQLRSSGFSVAGKAASKVAAAEPAATPAVPSAFLSALAKRNAEEISGSSSLRSTQRGGDVDDAATARAEGQGVTTDLVILGEATVEAPIPPISSSNGRVRKGPSGPILPLRKLPNTELKVFDSETLYMVSGRRKPSTFIADPDKWTLDPESVTMAQLCSDLRMGATTKDNNIAMAHKASLERQRDNYRRAKKWVEEGKTGVPNLRPGLDMEGEELPIPTLDEALKYNSNYVRPDEHTRNDGFVYIKAEGLPDMPELSDEEEGKKGSLSDLKSMQDRVVKALDSQLGGRKARPDLKIKGGKFVVDQSSTVINRHENVEAGREGREVEERTLNYAKPTTSVTHRRNDKAARWTIEETQRFFLKLSEWGSDFNLISQFFPGRTRRQIKNKFKLEERNNPTKIHLALVRKLDVNIDQYRTKEGSSVVNTAKEIEKKLEKIREEHATRMKREEAAKAVAKQADRVQALEKEKQIVTGHTNKMSRAQRARNLASKETVVGELPVKSERR